MGKRKERRLAALSNAGRRVKLDLFAEPSEDLGGSSVHEEVDEESKHRAGLPNSPSSSGQQPPNPLLLLGQYSDDELDDESDKRLDHGSLDGSISDPDDQAKGPLNKTCKDTEVDTGEGLDTLKVSQQNMEKDSTTNVMQSLVGFDNTEGVVNFASESVKKNDSTEQISVAGTSEVQIVGDVGSGWRIVMHEESNQYYYWNIETGETSWEVPNVLHQINQSTSDQKAPTVENIETTPVGAYDLKSTLSSQSGGGSLILQNKVYDNDLKLDEQDVVCKIETLKDKNLISSGNRSEFQSSSDAVDTRLAGGSLDGSVSYTNDVFGNDENKTEIDSSTHLLEQGECLLERLKSLKVSEDNLQGQGWISKCILEVEIRLSDIKSLLSYGSSLSPFWVHCGRQLKLLEGIVNDKIYQLAKSAVMEEAEEAPTTFGEKLKTKEGSQNQVEADGEGINAVSSSPEISHVSTDVDTLTVVNTDLNNQVPSNNAANVVNVPSFVSPTEHLEMEEGELVDGDTHCGEANSKTGIHAGEDVDMDVDMEVEDAIPESTIALNTFEQLNPSANYSSVPPPPDEWIPPPPPDNEPVPPPPPDNEQFPPPPPDEPPEHSNPPLPSYVETTPLAYAEQYNLAYSDSSYQYYGHAVSEVSVSGFYGHGDGCQIATPHASVYYQAVPNIYSESAPATFNPAEPVIVYDLQGRRVSSAPIASGTESSQSHSEVGNISWNTLAPNQTGSDDDRAVAGPAVRGDVATVSGKTEVTSVGISSTATIEAPATISVKESFTTASEAATASSSAPKVQSKAARTKKRTVAVTSSLRSNKKVSSLVDKWKAAKEELEENAEDEPENAYKILEKKRQKEIEEWHAQQLASGEAKDNANFQPLGGDWREKVKRRRAQKAKESAETPSEVLPDGNQQPDLDELSRDLPSGWQAYWDEASKQVYYGNVNTSETTWIRPTK
ncbi:hypothetical protein DITRI_Ditri01bG0200100 [Diplodiscus trichospermus]